MYPYLSLYFFFLTHSHSLISLHFFVILLSLSLSFSFSLLFASSLFLLSPYISLSLSFSPIFFTVSLPSNLTRHFTAPPTLNFQLLFPFILSSIAFWNISTIFSWHVFSFHLLFFINIYLFVHLFILRFFVFFIFFYSFFANLNSFPLVWRTHAHVYQQNRPRLTHWRICKNAKLIYFNTFNDRLLNFRVCLSA